jgi:hypothetical protein
VSKLRSAVGALFATLALICAIPALASAQTAPWNDPTYGSDLHANMDYSKPLSVGFAHDVSTSTADIETLQLAGDAEMAVVPDAESAYVGALGPIDTSNTYAIGATDTQLIGIYGTSRVWDVYLQIYTINNPIDKYHSCDYHYHVQADFDGTYWDNTITRQYVNACYNIPTTGGRGAFTGHVGDLPYPNLPRVVAMTFTYMSRWSSEVAVRDYATPAFTASHPAENSANQSHGVNYSVQLDADTWYTIFTVTSATRASTAPTATTPTGTPRTPPSPRWSRLPASPPAAPSSPQTMTEPAPCARSRPTRRSLRDQPPDPGDALLHRPGRRLQRAVVVALDLRARLRPRRAQALRWHGRRDRRGRPAAS